MEQTSCNIFGRCRNRETGELTKVSELHRDLIGLGKIQTAFSRQKANDAFYLSQSPKFLDRYREDLIMTSEQADSEPKLASFYEAAHQIMPEVKMEDIRNLLAKKFKEGVYSYQEAFDKMQKFNQQKEGGAYFIGTLVPQSDGKYQFKIAYNSREEQNALIQTLADRNTAEAILKQLENLKVGIVKGARSMYDTTNPSTLTNGFLGIITLKEGSQGAAYHIKDLANETGHLVVGMLGENNKFYQRLKNAIDQHPEIIKELLGEDEYGRYKDTKNATKEFMGHLVGLYLEQWDNIKPNSKLKTFKTLIQRAVDWLYSQLHFTNRDFYAAQYNAKWAAYKMAKDFMGNNFQGTMENALASKEQLFGDFGEVYKHLIDSLEKLHQLVESSKDYGYKTHKNYNDAFHQLMTKFHELTLLNEEKSTAFDQQQIEELSAETLTRLASFLTNEMQQTKILLGFALRGVDSEGNPLSISEQARVIKYAEQVYQLSSIVADYYNDAQYIKDEDLKDEITQVIGRLSNMLTSSTEVRGVSIQENYQKLINEARRKLALKLLTKINGNEFIAMEQHVHLSGLRVVRSAAKASSIDDIFSTNISTLPVTRWIDSMADNPDIVNQLVYQVVEEKKHEANVETLNYKDRLFELYKDLRRLGIKDTRRFYELDSKGHITGNFISERNWGEWERQYKEDKKKFEDEWYESHKDLFKTQTDMYHNTIYLTAFGAWREGWHNDHSVKIEVTNEDGSVAKYPDGKTKKRWAPAISTDKGASSKVYLFDSKQWADLQKEPQTAEWFKKYMTLKRELDTMIPDGSTNAFGVRAPQFTGTLTDKYTNVFKGDGTMSKVMDMSIRRWSMKNIAFNPSDTEYGGEDNTYDNDDLYSHGETIFTRAHSNALRSIERVPIYGVKKLYNLDLISTDLIQSTLAYAAMATSYKCLNEVADAAEQLAISRESQQKEKTLVGKLVDRFQLWGYDRLADYLNQQVYNNYLDPTIQGPIGEMGARLSRKLAGAAANIGSVWMLGFNVHSAITNALTGFNEIWKEACSGEEFNRKDFIWAIHTFGKDWTLGFLQNVCNIPMNRGSIIESTTKLDLFTKLYDISNENERKFREYHIQTVGYGFTKGYSYQNIAMLPYSITDQWMQAMSYLAVAKHTKLKNKKDGRVYSLWDAYTVVKDKKTVTTKKGKTKEVKIEPRLVLRDVETGGEGREEDWLVINENQAKLNKILTDKEARGETLSSAEIKSIYQYELVPGVDPITGLSTNPDGTPVMIVTPKKDAEGNPVLIDPYVPFDYIQQTKYKTRCRAINDRLHGVYNRGDGGAFQKFAIATLAASMKKYAIGLIERRFSLTKYDARTGKMKQGSTTTMINILLDCFTTYSSGDDGKVINFLDSMKYSDGWYVLGTASKILYGLTKFLYITLGPSASRFGVDAYLRNRGYSENQLANVRRFWSDMFQPIFIRLMMSFLAPPVPDDDDEDDSIYEMAHDFIQKGVDAVLDNELTNWASDEAEELYLAIVKNSIFGDVVIEKAKEKVLTKKYLDYTIKKQNKDKNAQAFRLKPILYYQAYRTLLEQKAYDVTRPLSVYYEYKGLIDTALPASNALYDIYATIALCAQSISEEDLAEMSKKERIKYNDGKEIYTRGQNKYWYKWAKKLLKVGPMRSPEIWLNGYASKEAMEYYKEPFSKGKHEEGIYEVLRK